MNLSVFNVSVSIVLSFDGEILNISVVALFCRFTSFLYNYAVPSLLRLFLVAVHASSSDFEFPDIVAALIYL